MDTSRLKRGRFHLAGESQLRCPVGAVTRNWRVVAIKLTRGPESRRTNEKRETLGEFDNENQEPKKPPQEPAQHIQLCHQLLNFVQAQPDQKG